MGNSGRSCLACSTMNAATTPLVAAPSTPSSPPTPFETDAWYRSFLGEELVKLLCTLRGPIFQYARADVKWHPTYPQSEQDLPSFLVKFLHKLDSDSDYGSYEVQILMHAIIKQELDLKPFLSAIEGSDLSTNKCSAMQLLLQSKQPLVNMDRQDVRFHSLLRESTPRKEVNRLRRLVELEPLVKKIAELDDQVQQLQDRLDFMPPDYCGPQYDPCLASFIGAIPPSPDSNEKKPSEKNKKRKRPTPILSTDTPRPRVRTRISYNAYPLIGGKEKQSNKKGKHITRRPRLKERKPIKTCGEKKNILVTGTGPFFYLSNTSQQYILFYRRMHSSFPSLITLEIK